MSFFRRETVHRSRMMIVRTITMTPGVDAVWQRGWRRRVSRECVDSIETANDFWRNFGRRSGNSCWQCSKVSSRDALSVWQFTSNWFCTVRRDSEVRKKVIYPTDIVRPGYGPKALSPCVCLCASLRSWKPHWSTDRCQYGLTIELLAYRNGTGVHRTLWNRL